MEDLNLDQQGLEWWNLTFAEAGFAHFEGLEPLSGFFGAVKAQFHSRPGFDPNTDCTAAGVCSGWHAMLALIFGANDVLHAPATCLAISTHIAILYPL